MNEKKEIHAIDFLNEFHKRAIDKDAELIRLTTEFVGILLDEIGTLIGCDCPDFSITTDYPPSRIEYDGNVFINRIVTNEQIAKSMWDKFKLWNIETGGHKSPAYFPYWLDAQEASDE